MGIVEAMAAGTPVVAWENGGPTVTVVDGKTGYLVPPYDTELFADRLHRVASSRSLSERMGRAGHQRAEQLFSYARHNELVADALLSALGRAVPDLVREEATIAEPVWVEK